MPVRRLALALAALTACDDGAATGDRRDPDDVPTYSQHVEPIIAAQCRSCHVLGGIAPFALDGYEAAAMHADEIRAATTARIMPPSNVDASGDCQTFHEPRWLSDEEIRTIDRWVVAGMPPGPALAPSEQPMPDRLGDDATVIDLGGEYLPVFRSGTDDMRCFVVDPGLAEDRFVTAIEVVPGAPAEVHHVLLFSLMSDEADRRARELDEGDEGLGYGCFGGAGVFQDTSVAGAWAPGGGVVRYPEGTGPRLAAGHGLILQIHYSGETGGPPTADRTAVKLQLVPEIEREGIFLGVFDLGLALEAGHEEVEFSYEFPMSFWQGFGIDTFELWGVFPHMHTLGRTQELVVVQDGVETCLSRTPAWDFHWQDLYFYDRPVTIGGDATFKTRCTFDTSRRTETVFFGEDTSDEMCLVGLYGTVTP